MKRSYWFMVAAAGMMVVFSLIGWIAEPVIPEHGGWIILKMAAFSAKGGGLALAGVFLLFAALNWLGSRWDIDSKKLDYAPMYLVMGGAFAMMVGLVLAMISGAMSTLGTIGLFGFGLGGLVVIAVAFFIRGMVREKSMEEVVAEWRRQQHGSGG